MLAKTAFKNIKQLPRNEALRLAVSKKKFHRDIRDFQSAVTFLFKEMERKFWQISESFWSQLSKCQILKKIWQTKNDVTLVTKRIFFETFRKLRHNGATNDKYKNFWVQSKEGINIFLLICRSTLYKNCNGTRSNI